MYRKLKVAIVGTAGIPARYGGFETLAQNLVDYLSDRFDWYVYCSSSFYNDKKLEIYKNAKLKYINLKPNGWQSILYDILSIFDSVTYADVVILMGVSGALVLPFVRLFSNIKIVTHLDGLEWKRGKWNVFIKLLLKFFEFVAVKFSHKLIADNIAIRDYIEDAYKLSDNVVLIEYGGNQSKKIKFTQEILEKYPFLKNKYAFSVCRIEPENNVEMVLDAFATCSHLNIVFVGNWDGNKYAQKIFAKYSKYKNVYLVGPIYDLDELNTIRSNAYVYIHGHSVGGTNPSLVEAMFVGLPVICYNSIFNVNTTENKALYFSSAKELYEIISSIQSYDLNEIGNQLYELANIKYDWDHITDKYRQLINRQ
ncbi:MAG: DUF1972 domain-containing protein [Candidatus Dojkabacteria bacterium]|nr:DUF1972 domain-containing protein [Candidatus Dojkabacteria bacterium]